MIKSFSNLVENNTFSFKVYKTKSDIFHCGCFLVGANCPEEANRHIRDFLKKKVQDDFACYEYNPVTKEDAIEDVFSERAGVLHFDSVEHSINN